MANKELKLNIVKLTPTAKLPIKKKTQTDSGFDVYADSFKQYYRKVGTGSESLVKGDDIKDYLGEVFNDETKSWDTAITLFCNERVLIGTGIAGRVSEGYEIQVRARSGVALKQGLIVTNSPGTVDFEYTGEIGVIITNTSAQPQTISLNSAIAQIVPVKVELIEINVVESFESTARNADGYGSTGKN